VIAFEGNYNTCIVSMLRDLATIQTVAVKGSGNPRQLRQSIRLLEERRHTIRFIGKRFTLRSTDHSPNTIRMRSFVQGIKVLRRALHEVEAVERIAGGGELRGAQRCRKLGLGARMGVTQAMPIHT
jgi:hypothetical protein